MATSSTSASTGLELPARGERRSPDATIYPSPFSPIEIPARPVTDYVFSHLTRSGEPGAALQRDRPAFIDGATGRTWTHGEMLDGARRIATGLTASGFGPGRVLGIMAPNVPEYALAFHGAAIAGGAVTVIDPAFRPAETHHQLLDAGVTHLVATRDTTPTALEAMARTDVTDLFVIGGHDDGHSFEDLLEGDPMDQVPVDPESTIAALPYSCGVEGLPKGVMLTHRCLTSNLAQLEAVFPIDDDESTVAILPFFHAYGLEVIMNGVLQRRARAVTMSRFAFEPFLANIEQHRATRVYVVPPIVLALAMHPAVSHFDLSSLRQVMSGGAMLDPEVAARASDRLGCEVTQGYGLTEASPVTHSTPLGHDLTGSSGWALPNTETRIVDPGGGGDVGRGEVGEVWVRGPQVMKGYRHHPTATRAVLDDAGWLRTGDLGRLDDDLRLFIAGRRKEIFKCKGAQVSPVELEKVISGHPDVVDSAVVGIPDPIAGEVPLALIVPTRDGVDIDEIKAFVAQRVARHKRVREITLVDEIPRDRDGTIDRSRLPRAGREPQAMSTRPSRTRR